MISPISSLANMEMALYGGFGTNSNAPSYLNGYLGANNVSYGYPSFQGHSNPHDYYNYNYQDTIGFGQTIPSAYQNFYNEALNQAGGVQQTGQSNALPFEGLTQADKQALMDDYKKSLTPSEGLVACAASNALFSATMHPRLIAHPINSIKALKATNAAFAAAKLEGSALNALWKNPENSNILREAWFQYHKAVARCQGNPKGLFKGKLGAFRQSYVKSGDVEIINNVLKNLENALKQGDMAAITKHTAELQHAYVNNGFLSRLWQKISGKPAEKVAERLADKAGIQSKIEEMAKTSGTLTAEGKMALEATTKTTFKDMLKRGGGVKGGIFFAGMELLLNAGKIKTAFEQDKKTGMKQLGQTTVKAVGNAAGWALGEAAGVWAFTKLGATIGTALGPGVGTLIGGVVGFVGGGIGMWLAGKITKKLVGQDVADDIEARKMANSSEGQVQLLQITMNRIQNGEKVSRDAQMAVQKIMTQYA